MATKKTTARGAAHADTHRRVAAWLVLAGMGGTSLTFNVWHAAHGHLPVGLALLYGISPVLAAGGLSHIAGGSRAGWQSRVITVVVMLGAMGLSVGAVASVVEPVAPGLLRFVFPAVMDAASLVALQELLSGRQVAPATADSPRATSTATAGGLSGGATSDSGTIPAAAGGGARDADGPAPGKRGDIRRVMRVKWDSEIAENRIPNGADLNRAAGKDPDYSLGKRYAAEWRGELSQEMTSENVREWREDAGAGVLAAGAAR